MRRGWILLLVAPLVDCSAGNVSEPIGTSSTQCASDAATLSAASGASVADTAQALGQLYALVGSIPTADGNISVPTSLAELQTALRGARDAIQSNQTTLGGAIAGIDDLLGGSGPLYDRATQAMAGGTGVQAQYAALLAQVSALTAASGLSLTSTTQAVTALQNTSNVNGTLADIQSALATLMTATDAASLTQLDGLYTGLRAQVTGLQSDTNQLLSLTGATGGLGDVVTAVTDALVELETNASTLAGAVSDVATLVGQSSGGTGGGSSGSSGSGSGGSVYTEATAVATLLGGSGSLLDRATALGNALDGNTTDAWSKLQGQLALLESGAAVLSTAVADVDASLGGTGTTNARAAALTSSISTLLTDSGSSSLGDITTLLNDFKSCAGTSTTTEAQAALCPASLGGYAALSCPQGAGGGNAFMLAAKTGFTNFSDIASANEAAGVISLVFNDGNPASTYSVQASAATILPVAPAGTLTLTNGSKSITLVNTSGSSLTSAASVVAGLQDTFVGAVMVPQNTCAGVAQLDVIVGGQGQDLETRLQAIDAQITTSPTDITDDLLSAITSLDSSATVLSDAISTVSSLIE